MTLGNLTFLRKPLRNYQVKFSQNFKELQREVKGSMRRKSMSPFSFSSSSWLVTLLLAVKRPFALLFLLIIIVLGFINVLTRYINSHLGTIKLMVIKPQYKQVSTAEKKLLSQDITRRVNIMANAMLTANFMFKSIKSLY